MLKAKPADSLPKHTKSAKILAHFSTKKTEQDNITTNYNQYFTSGVYKQRYPKTNSCTVEFIDRYINRTDHTHILDYGCGSGRYLMPLLQQYPIHHFTAYDISPAPLEILKNNLQTTKQLERVDIVSDFDALYHHIHRTTHDKPIGVTLLLFGVLSHIASPIQRQGILSLIRRSLDDQGYLIISVPNKKRRFLHLQRQQQNHEVTYQRIINDQVVQFYYHLYSAQSIRREIEMAGLRIVEIKAESILPESWVTNFSLLGWLDRQLYRWIPASWGYGILICCQPHQ